MIVLFRLLLLLVAIYTAAAVSVVLGDLALERGWVSNFLDTEPAATELLFPAEAFDELVPGRTQTGGRPEAVLGRYPSFEYLSGYVESGRLRNLSQPVGRLTIDYEEGVGYCTASLIASNLALTNHHCVPGDGRYGAVRTARLDMGFYARDDNAGLEQFAILDGDPTTAAFDAVDSQGEPYDYSVLRVDGAPGDRWGVVDLDKTADGYPGQELIVIHHPAGYPKHVTRRRCFASKRQPEQAEGLTVNLHHHCDTVGGSSGAPIFDAISNELVALHYWGSPYRDELAFNKGKSISSIISISSTLRSLLEDAAPLSVVGEAFQFTPIRGLVQALRPTVFADGLDDIALVSNAVARLDVLVEDRMQTCTSILIEPDLVLTPLGCVALGEEVTTITTSADRLALGTADGGVRLYSLTTDDEIARIETNSYVRALGLSPDGERITVGSKEDVSIWSISNGLKLASFGVSDYVTSVAVSPDGTQVFVSLGSGRLTRWDTNTGELIWEIPVGQRAVTTAAVAPDGLTVVVGSNDRSAHIFDAQSGAQLATLTDHSGPLNSVNFAPDASRILTGSWDATAKVWDADGGAPLVTLEGHKGSVLSAAFTPDGRRILTGSDDRTIRVWDAQTGESISVLEFDAPVYSVSLIPATAEEGPVVVAGLGDGSTVLSSLSSGETVKTFQGSPGSAKDAIVVIGYDDRLEEEHRSVDVAVQPIAFDKQLGLAVLRAREPVTENALTLAQFSTVQSDFAILIGHPYANPKVFSGPCTVGLATNENVGRLASANSELAHNCDSAPGTLGAPLVTPGGVIIGLHSRRIPDGIGGADLTVAIAITPDVIEFLSEAKGVGQ